MLMIYPKHWFTDGRYADIRMAMQVIQQMKSRRARLIGLILDVVDSKKV